MSLAGRLPSGIMLVSSLLFYCVAGELRTLKNSPSFLPFSSVFGGYQLMSAGFPSKKSDLDLVSTWLMLADGILSYLA